MFEIPGNGETTVGRWLAIQECQRLSQPLHPSNKTRQGNNTKSFR